VVITYYLHFRLLCVCYSERLAILLRYLGPVIMPTAIKSSGGESTTGHKCTLTPHIACNRLPALKYTVTDKGSSGRLGNVVKWLSKGHYAMMSVTEPATFGSHSLRWSCHAWQRLCGLVLISRACCIKCTKAEVGMDIFVGGENGQSAKNARRDRMQRNGTIRKCSSRAFQWMVMSVSFDNRKSFGQFLCPALVTEVTITKSLKS
jgi:hypothetical protein